MRIAFVAYNSFSSDWTPEDLLSEFFTARDWANALTQKGATVDLYFRFNQHHLHGDGAITYHFIKDLLPSKIKNFHLPVSYLRKVSKNFLLTKPDIIHVHNLEAVMPHLLLRTLMCKNIPIVIQDHGSLPRNKMHYLQKWAFPHFDGFLFSAKGQEDVWVAKGLISSRKKCFFILENSSPFSFRPRNEARAVTKMHGNPVFLWVGNLNQNKDPMTIISAFVKVLPQMVEAKLYMIYRQNEQEEEIRAQINGNILLQESVNLLGAKRRTELENYYNSADYIISGSHKEALGYSVVEALSCGVIPVLTNIDAFKFITNNGEVGVLWEVGDVSDLSNKLLLLKGRDIKKYRTKTLRHFNKHLQFDSLADQCLAIYQRIIEKKEN